MNKTRKLASILQIVLMVVSVVLFVLLVINIDDEKNPGSVARLWIERNILWAYILFGLATVITVLFSIVQIFTDKAKAKSAIISLIFMGGILAISYALASGDLPSFFGVEKFIADGSLTESVSKWVGTGLYMTYILSGLTVGSIVVFGIGKLFKR